MKTKTFFLLITFASLLFSACAAARASTPLSPTPISEATSPVSLSPVSFPKIDRHPDPADWGRGKLSAMPTYDPNSQKGWQVDLRAYDLSSLDLRDSLSDLAYASFDDRTTWPPAERMPKDYDYAKITEYGKNSGLGIHSLHTQGITGRGVGIAIIDQTLLVDHQEYAAQLRLYEELDDIVDGWRTSQMHGPAVASIAVGKTVGVAPEADLYYIATSFGNSNSYENNDFTYLARAVRRILEINQQLPDERKIRVLSMSVGWGPDMKGYQEITAAVAEAKAAGLLVVCSSIEEVHGFKFHGLGRVPTADPDAFESYEPGAWWANDFYAGMPLTDRLLVPMDSRATASPMAKDEYAFYREGGWSWAIPYIAGVYALAAQADPTITPDLFWAKALETARTSQITHEGQTYSFGPILDPQALIQTLKN